MEASKTVLLIETLLVLTAIVLGMIMVMIVLRKYLELPVTEMKLLLTFTMLILLFWSSYLPITLLSTSDAPSELGIAFFKVSISLGYLSVFFLSLTLFYPEYRLNGRSIVLLGFITILAFVTAIHNAVLVKISVHDSLVKVETGFLGLSLFFLNVVVVITLLVKRVRKIRNLTGIDPQVASIRLLSLNVLFISLSLAALLFTRSIQFSKMPGLTWLVPASLTALVFMYSISKDEALLFMTDSQLLGALYLMRDSGLVLYSVFYSEKLPRDGGLGSLVTALNLNLTDMLKTSYDMKEIHFGDKSIVLANGNKVSLLLIVTHTNLVVKSLAEFFVKQFEREFQPAIEHVSISGIVKTASFIQARAMIERIKNFFPSNEQNWNEAMERK